MRACIVLAEVWIKTERRGVIEGSVDPHMPDMPESAVSKLNY